MKQEDETYLGDGLYASFDGYQICLRAPQTTGDACVYLEPSVLHSFMQYVSSLKETPHRD